MGCLWFVWWGLGLGWPVLGQTSHRGKVRDDAFWRSLQAQQFTHWEEKCPAVPAISDWWLAQGLSLVLFAWFVSHIVLGTIPVIFVDCPSPLLLSTYIGLCLRQLVDGPALWHHSRRVWLWAHISLQASSRLGFHPASALLLALPLADRWSFRAWHWL